MKQTTPGASAPETQAPEAPAPSKGELFLEVSITAYFLDALAQIVAFGTDYRDIGLSSHQFFCLIKGLSAILKADAKNL
jgi:hypothetical protein